MIFFVAAALFLANFLLGVLVQLGLVDTKPFRWVHHALFFCVCVSAALAAAWGLLTGEAYGLVLVPALVIYYFLPRTKGGTLPHGALASVALIFYVAGFVLVL